MRFLSYHRRIEGFLNGRLSHLLSGRTPGMLGKIPYLLCLRGSVLFVVAVRFAIPWSQRAGSTRQIVAMVTAMLVLFSAMAALRRYREEIRDSTYRSMMAFSVLLDVALITWAYTLTGKVTSDFFLFYYLPILTAAEYLSLGDIGTAVLLAVLGLGAGLLLSSAVEDSVVATGVHRGFDLTAMWATRGGFLVLFALVSILRTRFQRHEGERLQKLLEVQRLALYDFRTTDLNERMVEWLLHHLTEDLDFDFAAVSVVNPHAGTISMTRARNVELGWMRNTCYPLTYPDILTDVVRRRAAEVIVGKDARFNSVTFTEYGHENLARIFAPLMLEGLVVGVLETGCTRDRETHVREHLSYVSHLAVAMGAPVSAIPTHSTLAKVAERASQAAEAKGAVLLLLEDGNLTHAVSTEGMAATLILQQVLGQAGRLAISPGEGSDSTVVDGANLEKCHPHLHSQGIRSVAAFRLVSSERTFGMLYLCFGRERPTIGEADRQVLRGIANAMEGVILNRLLLDEASSNAQWAWMIAHQQPVLQSLVGEREHEVVLQALVEDIKRTMAADSVVLYPYVHSSGEILEPVSAGVGTRVTRAPSLDSPPRKLLAGGRTNFVHNVQRDRGAEAGSFARRESVKSCAEVVLRGLRSNEVSGVMFINYCQPQNFYPKDRDTISTLAAGANIAIQAARLYRKANPTLAHVQHEFAVLKKVDDLIADSLANLDISLVLAEVLDQARSSSRASSAALYLPAGNGSDVRRRTVRGNESLHPQAVASGQGVVGRAASGPSPAIEIHGPQGAASELGIPLRSGASLLGVLHLVHPDPDFFRDADRGLVEALGMQGMIALRSMSSIEALESLVQALTKVAASVQTTDGDLSLRLRLVLTGITAKQGLGYTRAMVFRVGANGRQVEGLGAVGPWDGGEAERFWKATDGIETESRAARNTLDELLARAAQYERDVMAGKSRETLDLAIRRPFELPAQIAGLLREISAEPLRGIRKPGDSVMEPFLSDLRLEAFGKRRGFVILPLKAGVADGFILADREFQDDPAAIARVDVGNLGAFAEMAALAVSSDNLRNTLSDEHKREDWDRYFRSTMHTLNGALSDARSPVSEWETLLDGGMPLPGQFQESVKQFRERIERLRRIVTSLQDYSRPAIVSFGKVKLRDVVRKAVEGQPDVDLRLCAEDPVISGDAGRIEEALRNLVTNSHEALGSLPVESRLPITVSLRIDGKWAMIEVRDEAGGFPDNIRNSIGLEWNSTKGKSRGMGLPIVKRVVAGHGGEFLVHTTPARGSSILVKLPICQEAGGDSNAETAAG